MRSLIEKHFSDSDRERIVEATRDAEARTAGELVCYIVERCDHYRAAAWQTALAVGVLSALGAAFWREHLGGWGAPDHIWVMLALGLGSTLGWLLAQVDPWTRWLTGDEMLTRRAESRAAEAFLEEKVFATQRRTGVLLFLALFEHRVVVLADEGIHAKVQQDAWRHISDQIASGMRAGQPASALIEGVRDCAALLEQHGVTTSGPSPHGNELSDEPRFRKN